MQIPGIDRVLFEEMIDAIAEAIDEEMCRQCTTDEDPNAKFLAAAAIGKLMWWFGQNKDRILAAKGKVH